MANTGPIMKGMINGSQIGMSPVSGDNNHIGDIFKMLASTLIFRDRDRAEIDGNVPDRLSRWVN